MKNNIQRFADVPSKHSFDAWLKRVLRAFAITTAMGVAFFPLTILLALPGLPKSIAGWAALLFLPFTLAALGDWLFEYRDFRLLRPIDQFAERIQSNQCRLALTVLLIAVAAAGGFGILFAFA